MSSGVAFFTFNVFSNTESICHVFGAPTSITLAFHDRPSFLLNITERRSAIVIVAVLLLPLSLIGGGG